jgi:hypothetical protein
MERGARALFLPADSPGDILTNSTAGWAAITGDPLAVALISAAVGFVLGAITIYLSFLARRYVSAKWNHKAAFLALIKNPRESEYRVQYDGQLLNIPPFRWAEQDASANKLLGHLQSPRYRQLAAAVGKARANREAHVAAMNQALAGFRSRVDSAVGEITGLTEWAGVNLGPGVGILYVDTLRKLIFEDFRTRLGPGYMDPVDVAIIPNPSGVLGKTDHAIVWNSNYRVAEGTREQMVSLNDRLRPLITNGDLRSLVEQIEGEDRARASDSSIADFESQRESLIERLDAKQEALVGKCPLCPGFLGIQPKLPD